jgi:excisionase family DNA binding protein
MKESQDGFLRSSEAAKYLNMSQSVINRMARDRAIPFHQAGTMRRYKISELEEWAKLIKGPKVRVK